MKFLKLGKSRQSSVGWLASRLLPAKESMHTRILREAERQGLRVVDRSAGALLRLSLCVARRSATESLPVAVASCLRHRVARFTPRRPAARKAYRKREVLEELRRQQVDVTNASAGWMMRFMACVSTQVLSKSLPDSVQSCLIRNMRRIPARAARSVRHLRRQ